MDKLIEYFVSRGMTPEKAAIAAERVMRNTDADMGERTAKGITITREERNAYDTGLRDGRERPRPAVFPVARPAIISQPVARPAIIPGAPAPAPAPGGSMADVVRRYFGV